MKISLSIASLLILQCALFSGQAHAKKQCFWNDGDYLTGREYCIYGLSAVRGITSREACEAYCAQQTSYNPVDAELPAANSEDEL